jgi:hypothetical protein
MNTQLQGEVTLHDVELAGACAGCGGPLAARLAPGSARGVCVACHAITALLLVRAGEGVRVVQAPVGLA